MIATAPTRTNEAPDPWRFQSEYKQRVSDYFKQHPDGTYDHFLDTWSRAHQIGRSIFDEVYVRLQKAGVIQLVKGGKAHDQLLKDMERKVRDEYLAKNPPPPAPEPAPAPAPVVESVPTASTTEKESPMASSKEWSLAELAPEERTLLDKTLQAKPGIEAEDLNNILGFRLKKSVYHSTMYAIKLGKYNYPGINGSHRGVARPPTTPAVSHTPSRGNMTALGSGNTPLVNFTRINGIQIIGPIDTEGHSKEEIKMMRAWLPTVLSEILDKRMQFKIVQYTEDDENGVEKVTLEVRRIA